MKFVDVKNDVAFRKIFGNSKKSIVLISFLNAVLDLEGSNRISKVTIIDPYLLPRLKGEKASILDVRATDQRGRQFIVEMQVADKKGFDKRVQFYTSRDYSMQIDRGEDYPKLKPTYFIGILNFSIGFGKNYLSKHYSIEEETGQCVLSDIQHRFIQLTKFKKKRHELASLVDKWTFFIKNAGNLDVIPEDIEDEGLKTAYQEADKHSWKKEDLIAYQNAGMREQDQKGEIELARDEGKAEAEAKAEVEKEQLRKEAEAKEEQLRKEAEAKEEQTILNFYQNGVNFELIAISTRKTVEEIQQIIAKNKK
ncbi:MAG: Rpn family recombination-promoting nuclease/putative transposase [Chitinophagales bacterium]|nr:Rpn family recombination-promoting nuclease/putative transposase [Chitinophagales bacterium]